MQRWAERISIHLQPNREGWECSEGKSEEETCWNDEMVMELAEEG